MSTSRRARAERGFTLVEVLTATTVLALLGLGFAALARTVGDGTARLGEAVAERELLLATRAFLRRELGRARALDRSTDGPVFVGTRERLRFVALAPWERGAAAIVYELEVRPEAAGSALWVRFAPLPPRGDPAAALAAARWRRTIAVDGRLELAYYGPARKDGVPGWYPATKMLRRGPEAVRLVALDAPERWPALLVRLVAFRTGSPAEAG